MTIDLSAAIAYGENAYRAAYFTGLSSIECRAEAIRAVAPLIEAAVREQVAREIDAEAQRRRVAADDTAAACGGVRDPHQDSIRAGFAFSARIARGEQR